MPSTVAVIPARMGSTRYPGKPLAILAGKPMIQHVWERTSRSASLSEALIATCDEEIREVAEAFGARVVMTAPSHERASDRVAEAVTGMNMDIVVMVQGDEPMVVPSMIDEALAPFEDSDVACVNLMGVLDNYEDFVSPNTIKVITDHRLDALYMSRRPIPTGPEGVVPLGVGKQVCIIPFRREALRWFTELPQRALERAESIDMLRFVEHGIPVRMVPTQTRVQAVDTPEDLERVGRLMEVAG